MLLPDAPAEVCIEPLSHEPQAQAEETKPLLVSMIMDNLYYGRFVSAAIYSALARNYAVAFLSVFVQWTPQIDATDVAQKRVLRK